MKALVMWARINRARLHIHEHTREHVKGLMVYGAGVSEPFVFDLAARRLALGEGDAARVAQLDEMGIEIEG
jgi:hypothetical protein